MAIMIFTRAVNVVKLYSKNADRIKEFDVSSATVELAAQALCCETCRIAKTLSFLVDGHAILIVTAGDVITSANIKMIKNFQMKICRGRQRVLSENSLSYLK